MEIKLIITKVLPLQEGVSQNGNPWKLQGYVGETIETHSRNVQFDLFGEEKINAYKCEVGQTVTVSYDIESREVNGRWFTSIRAWKIVKEGAAQEVAAQDTSDSDPFA